MYDNVLLRIVATTTYLRIYTYIMRTHTHTACIYTLYLVWKECITKEKGEQKKALYYLPLQKQRTEGGGRGGRHERGGQASFGTP